MRSTDGSFLFSVLRMAVFAPSKRKRGRVGKGRRAGKGIVVIRLLLVILLQLAASGGPVRAEKISPVVRGRDLLHTGEIAASAGGKEGLVIVFLSSSCPCSNSHIQEIRSLAAEYASFAFVAVHSNADEKESDAAPYFRKAKLGFPVVQDRKAALADAFKALKTPHAFLLGPDGEVLYAGGVSDSHDLSRSEHKFLREALEDARNHREVRTKRGRALGCVISREGDPDAP